MTATDRARWRRWATRVAFVAYVAVVTLAVAPRIAESTATLGPAEVGVRVQPARSGHTVLAFPPLGNAVADTHPGPIQVTFELNEIRSHPVLGRLRAEQAEAGDESRSPGFELTDLDGFDRAKLVADIEADLPGALWAVGLRLLLAGALVGAAAAALLPHRSWRRVAAGGAVGATAIAVLLATALPGFDPTAFERLKTRGTISSAPQLAQLAGSGLAEGATGRLELLADRLGALYEATATEGAGDDDVVILTISDLHLNPLGVQIARQMAQSFEVDATLDLGDTTSFGRSFEASFAELLADWPTPYFYAAGNHDSADNRRALGAIPGVTRIDGTTVEVDGVRILGFDDPTVTTRERLTLDERADRFEAAAPAWRRVVRRERPDLLAVHNPIAARLLAGTVPYAVAGHTHEFGIEARDGTLIATVGSTGATGLGDFLAEGDRPYEAQLLRFRAGELVAVDRVSLKGLSGDFEIRRTTVDDALVAELEAADR